MSLSTSLIKYLLVLSCLLPSYALSAKTHKLIVRGNSMAPCFKDGQVIEYQASEQFQRNDMVIFQRQGKLVLKRIVALPQDQFELKMDNEKKCFNVHVNQQLQKSLAGVAYCTTSKMLDLYKASYQGKVPTDTFLVLGEVSAGSEDSTLFGPLVKKDILGKLVDGKCR